MDLKRVVCIDFETMPIEKRPYYPPEPVGVAITAPGGSKPRYYAWGHRNGVNKHTKAEAKRALKKIWDSGCPILCHNAKFDLEVAHAYFDLPIPKWERIHDTMFMLFLLNPRAKTYGLKPNSEKILGMPPDEQDAVQDWLVMNNPIEGVKLRAGVKKGKSSPAPFIAYAPADVVGPYAIGDVVRTVKLAKHIYKTLKTRKMVEAYDRERELIPPILDMERQGLRVDVKRLKKDIKTYTGVLAELEAWLRMKLGKKDLNFNASRQLASALIRQKLATKKMLGKTESGEIAVNKEALARGVRDKQVLGALQCRAKLIKVLGTFMQPWYDVAKQTGGYIYTTWNTTRTDAGTGARTGRMSSTPNFQNMANEFEDIFESLDVEPPFDMPGLPMLRSYVIPFDDDHVLIDKDFSSQEIRVLANFERGALYDAYMEDPHLDPHTMAGDLILSTTGRKLSRKVVKTLFFGTIYGMGKPALSRKLKIKEEEAGELRQALYDTFPGMKRLGRETQDIGGRGEPIRTWVGREYYCEPPKKVELDDGGWEWRTMEYKLFNVLIQGSAADITKEALARYYKVKPKKFKVLLVTHDQITVSVPRKDIHRAMKQLGKSMESVEFPVPMKTDGQWSDKNFASLKPYNKGKSNANT